MFDFTFILKDNLSRGNLGAVKVLQELFPEPGRLQFIYADLGDAAAVSYNHPCCTVPFVNLLSSENSISERQIGRF